MHLARVVLALVLALPPLGASYAVDTPIDLKWGQLVPPAEAVKPKPKTFFSGAAPATPARRRRRRRRRWPKAASCR